MFGVLCEKPSAARNFSAALGGGTGVFEGESYVVCSARGHLFELKKPHDQVDVLLAERYKNWSVELLPWDMGDFRFERQRAVGASKTLDSVLKTLDACSDIVIATDDDPSGEGDLLAWEILIEGGFAFNSRVNIWRLRHSDETPEEIRRAWREKKLEPLGESFAFRKAWFRQRFDFLSMQFTRAATGLCDGETLLRQGRLKSVMVSLVGGQEKAWRDYVAKPFFVQRYRDDAGVIFKREDEVRFASVGECEAGESGWGVECGVREVSREVKHRRPPLLMDLAQLSAFVGKKYDLSAKVVMDTYQQMYEGHVVSYPRTEDKKITRAQFDELVPHVDAIAGLVGVDCSLLVHREPRKSHIGDGLAHGANRPTSSVPDSLEELDSRFGRGAKEIYRVLALSFLSMFMGDYVFEDVRGELVERPEFVGRLSVCRDLGWKSLEIFADDNGGGEDDAGYVGGAECFGRVAVPFVHEGKPKRPQRPSMTWLMKQLEKHNVGTGATRTSTFSQMIEDDSDGQLIRGLKKGVCELTEHGWWSYAMLEGTAIGGVELTEWVQSNMDLIGKGEADGDVLLEKVADFVRSDLQIMKVNGQRLRQEKGITMTEKAALGKDDYYQGEFQGEFIMLKRLWGTHRFTDEECAALCAGEMIEFEATSKAGKPYKARGCLAKQKFKGKDFVGFQLVASIPDSWCGYEFSDEEKSDLEAGKKIPCFGLMGKKGEFNAVLEWTGEKINVAQFL